MIAPAQAKALVRLLPGIGWYGQDTAIGNAWRGQHFSQWHDPLPASLAPEVVTKSH
jgi:hypothetical protein